MGLRGLGLLTREYSNSSFSRSPDKRWVIYERFSCPCLIDTENLSEELIGWQQDIDGTADGEGSGCGFTPVWNGSTVCDEVLWHPDSRMFAFSTGFGRYWSWVCIWQHGKGLTELNHDDVAKALESVGFRATSQGWLVDFLGWRGNVLELSCGDTCRDPELLPTLEWDPQKQTVSAIPKIPSHKENSRP